MVWSFSSSRMFQRCQRQWFIKQFVANANAKKVPLRREAYLLSTLQSLQAWRGSLVDQVISDHIVPSLHRARIPSEASILDFARSIFDRQLEFALENRMRNPGMTKSRAGNSYAALYAVEYGYGITKSDEIQAWHEIELALRNLMQMQDLFSMLMDGTRLIAQRALTFTCGLVRARMVPDLIVFHEHEAPLIVDWKVHTFGFYNARLQLASYALALTACNPHSDFPASFSGYKPEDIKLLEVQLLTRQQRYYSLAPSDIEDIETYVMSSQTEMDLATARNPRALSMFDFPTTSRPETCQRCSFRSICWVE